MLKRWILILSLLFAAAPVRSLAAPEAPAPAAESNNYPLVPTNSEEMKSVLPDAIWVLVIFLILLAILYPTAWKNVMAGLKAREERIRKDIADAELARQKAEATLRDYNAQLAEAEGRVRDMLDKARGDAEKIGTNLRLQAQKEVEEIKDRANREIEDTKRQALGEIYEQTADLATMVAEKILRRNLTTEDNRELVNQSLEQLATVGKD